MDHSCLTTVTTNPDCRTGRAGHERWLFLEAHGPAGSVALAAESFNNHVQYLCESGPHPSSPTPFSTQIEEQAEQHVCTRVPRPAGVSVPMGQTRD